MRKHVCLFYACLFAFAYQASAQKILSESFEGAFPPTGWTLVNAGTGNTWTQNTVDAFSYHGTNSMTYVFNDAEAANAWAFTPTLTLNNAKGYYVTFYVRAADAPFPESLKFTVGNATTLASQTTTLLDSADITNTTFRKWSAYYKPATTGSYNFAFNCYSLADELNLYVDSVSIFEGNPLASCSGTPVGGTAVSSALSTCSSASITLTVNGSSSTPGLTYQWQSSPAGANIWTDIAGATNAGLVTTVSVNTDYRRRTICVASATSANSTPVNITITAVPLNDSVCFAIPLVLNGPAICGNTDCATGYGTTSTGVAGNPAFSGSTPNNTVWYTFTPVTSGVVELKFKRPAGVTTGLLNGWLGIYTVSGLCPFTFTEVPSSIQYDLTTNDSVRIASPPLTAGTTYYFMVDGAFGSTGSFCIQVNTAPSIPVCTTLLSPANGSTNLDNVFTLRWRKVPGASGYKVYLGNTTPPAFSTNVTDTSVILGATVPNSTLYWYVVPTNSSGDATGCNATIFSFTTRATATNDSCGAPITLMPGNSVLGTTVGASQSLLPTLCSGSTAISPRAYDVWYSIRALSNGPFTISVDGDDRFDAVLGIYRGTCGALTLDTCRDAAFTGGVESITITNAVSNTTYLIRVYNYYNSSDSVGSFVINASGTALPVTGVVLSGVRNGSKAQLSWKTLTETNNAGFELQRSADGRDFTGIANIASKANSGNSAIAIPYSAEDAKPFTGANYYRLKQTDKNGKINYSNTVYLKGTAVKTLTLSAVYPNPTSNVLKAAIQAPATESITFVVTDMMGKVISRQVSTVTSGDNTVNINVANLPSGSYLLKAICRNGCETAYQKFTRQ